MVNKNIRFHGLWIPLCFFPSWIRWKSFFLKKFGWRRIYNARMTACSFRASDIQWFVCFFTEMCGFGGGTFQTGSGGGRLLCSVSRAGKAGGTCRNLSGTVVSPAGDGDGWQQPVTVSFPSSACLGRPFCPWCRRMRIDVATDTYEPDVNGVALTLERLVRGLRTRGHLVHPFSVHAMFKE